MLVCQADHQHHICILHVSPSSGIALRFQNETVKIHFRHKRTAQTFFVQRIPTLKKTKGVPGADVKTNGNIMKDRKGSSALCEKARFCVEKRMQGTSRRGQAASGGELPEKINQRKSR